VPLIGYRPALLRGTGSHPRGTRSWDRGDPGALRTLPGIDQQDNAGEVPMPPGATQGLGIRGVVMPHGRNVPEGIPADPRPITPSGVQGTGPRAGCARPLGP